MNFRQFFVITFLFVGSIISAQNHDFVIAFGSCNKQYMTNKLWSEISKHQPNLWIWGGDNVYADTANPQKLLKAYQQVLQDSNYQNLVQKTQIMATWDDHDYGKNDGGTEFKGKKMAQQKFLDFLGVPKSDVRRKQAGVYHAQDFLTAKGHIKVIVLDTRYFRTSLLKSRQKGKRYRPNLDSKATVLGKAQWQWLANELNKSTADFNILVSSIQFLSSEHGFETWGNFPLEQEKLKALLVASKAKRPLLLSGDRHISEISTITVPGLPHPLVDFTSSGLTHAYNGFTGEPNRHRVGEVISTISFGLLYFDFSSKSIRMEMRGEKNVLQQRVIQDYK